MNRNDLARIIADNTRRFLAALAGTAPAFSTHRPGLEVTSNGLGLEWIWDLSPMQMKALFQHAMGVDDIATPYHRELHMLAMTLIFESNTLPASAEQLLELCTAHGLARAWGGEYDSTGPWTGAAGVDHNIAMLLTGKQPVLPFVRVQLTNLLRTWTADPIAARIAAIKAGIPADQFVVRADLLRAVRGGDIKHVSAGQARFGRRAPLDPSQLD